MHDDIVKYLDDLNFTIDADDIKNKHIYAHSKNYTIDRVLINYHTNLVDRIEFTCFLGDMRKKFNKIFEREINRCDIIESLFNMNTYLNKNIDNSFSLELKSKVDKETLVLNAYIPYTPVSPITHRSIENMFNKLSETILANIEFIVYMTQAQNNDYIFISELFKNAIEE